ncbi:MAG: Kelch repeat-containing protein [Promethearchaeota archaeon]
MKQEKISGYKIRLGIRSKLIFLLLVFQILVFMPLIFNTNNANAVSGGTPEKRTGQQMIYDPILDEIVLYGGNRGGGDQSSLNSVWKYSISDSQWVGISSETTPVSRFGHQMVYLPLNRSIFLFGGLKNSDYERLSDTWLYYLDNNTWEEISPTESPSARSDSALCYDSLKNRVLLFGGYNYDHSKLNDLWVYYPNNNSWTELTPSSSPPTEYGHSLFYRNNGGEVYIFGRNPAIAMNAFWEYDTSANSWVEIAATSPRPSYRYWHNMRYSNISDVCLLFGGSSYSVDKGDSWIFNFTTDSWTAIQSDNNPPSRVVFSMCHDSLRDQIYIYGGSGEDYTIGREDFWKFNFNSMTWEEIEMPSNSSISGYNLLALCFYSLISLPFLMYIRKRQCKSQ